MARIKITTNVDDSDQIMTGVHPLVKVDGIREYYYGDPGRLSEADFDHMNRTAGLANKTQNIESWRY